MNGIRPDDGVPGSLSEGAAERSEAEGVSSDGSTGPMVYPPPIINSETFERLRSSKYTPSVTPVGRASSLREGAGRGLHHSTGYSLISGVSGDFHRPYENAKVFTFHHSSKYTPSVSPSGCQLPQRGSRGNVPTMSITRPLTKHQRAGDFLGAVCGVMFCHSTGYLRNRGVTGDFHRPYETQKILGFTTHRRTLPQSRFRSTAPSEREPGTSCTIHPTNQKPQRFWGDYFTWLEERRVTSW